MTNSDATDKSEVDMTFTIPIFIPPFFLFSLPTGRKNYAYIPLPLFDCLARLKFRVVALIYICPDGAAHLNILNGELSAIGRKSYVTAADIVGVYKLAD